MYELQEDLHMTTQRESYNLLSEELWNNAKIKNIIGPNSESKISNEGHGLFVKGEDGSIFADLRMSHDRPFWGHTHPLEVQAKYHVNNCLNQQFNCISSQAFYNNFLDYKKVTIDDVKNNRFENEKLFLEITESDILCCNNLELDSLTNEIEQSNKLWVHHICTSLLYEGKVFSSIFQDKNISIQPLPNHDFILTGNHLTYDTYSPLASTITDFVKLISDINSKSGINKFKYNQSIIDDYIKHHDQRLKRFQNYIILDYQADVAEFQNKGIVINNSNILKDITYLAIPVSCTKLELLSTLKVLSTLCED